jgi:pSer/pThr/pTyr-binding forkhead associated (FHA) protein
VSHVYCPQCGFLSPASANFCPRCGGMLTTESGVETTTTFELESGNEEPDTTLAATLSGPALVVRSGGGMAGQAFEPAEGKTLIGRSPECDIFLDDVTVSRRHAVLHERDGRYIIEDQGSLNGTFLNRRRIESAELSDGDELQIGKYRLTFLG